VSWVRGAAKCQYGPSQNASYLMTPDGNYYSATVADFAGRDAAVYRSMGPGRQLRTAQYNSRWLNGALRISAPCESALISCIINANKLYIVDRLSPSCKSPSLINFQFVPLSMFYDIS